MLTRISKYFYAVSTGWAVLFGLVVFAIFIGFVLPQQAQKAQAYSAEAGSPDTSFFYSAADLYRMAESYGAEGRGAYIRARFTFDLFWPLAYLLFLTLTVSWALARAMPEADRWRLLNLFPLAGFLFDYLENISAALVMGRYPSPTPIIDSLASIFTSFKWIFVNGSFVILIAGLLLALWRRMRTG